ncbi:MAG: hypothetical protein OEW66_04955, partial [Actinomycetota bacterium]|nr:hypothetical protein [Actinomycetota bacterium]
MKRSLIAPTIALALVTALPSIASALVPSETPADTFQVGGPRVRALVVVGNNVWIGGQFTQVQSGNGANVQSVSNLAVLDRTSGGLSSTATPLQLAGVTGAQVW